MDHPTAADPTVARAERSRLRQHLHRHPEDLEARAALAANHRAAGHADQAGRWGLLVPGASTSAERQAFATWVVRTGATDRGKLLKILFVPRRRWLTGVDPTGEIVEFEHLVDREHRRHLRGATTVSDDLAGLAYLIVPTALIGALVGVNFSVITLFFGGPAADPEQPAWFPTTWGRIWTDIGFGTLVAYGVVVIVRIVVLIVRLPSTLRSRRWFDRRSRGRSSHHGAAPED